MPAELACKEDDGASLGAAHAVHHGLRVEMVICQCGVAALLLYLVGWLQVHGRRRRTDGRVQALGRHRGGGGRRALGDAAPRTRAAESRAGREQRKRGPILPTGAQRGCKWAMADGAGNNEDDDEVFGDGSR